MAYPESPVVQRRRLRAQLKQARKEAGLTQKEAADLLAWHPSKLIRIEGGASPIAIEDLIGLLNRYGVTDQAQIDQWVEVAHGSRRKSWWDRYREAISATHYTFLEYEASASRLRTFQALLVPGLLQTRMYTEAVMRAYSPSEDRFKRGVEIREKRKEQLLDADSGPEMFFILDEAVIHRWVGGPAVMREQLLWLDEINKRPNIRIQVVRFREGAHPGMRGAFTIFEVPFEDEDYAVLLEHPHGDDFLQNDSDKVGSYLDTFFELEAIASAEEELTEIIRPPLDNMSGGESPPTIARS